MLTFIHRCDRMLARLEYSLLIFAFVALTLILSAQVIMRYFFSSPIFWVEEVAVQILISATFLGVSYLTYLDKLVRVDMILANINRSARRRLTWVITLTSLLTVLLIAFHATEWVFRPENQFDTSPTTGILKWYNYLTIVIGFYLMAIHLMVKMLTSLKPQHESGQNEEESC
ncbi:TRAP transporter small permease [Vibrio cincinnatiensis]|uniref:TRAP transporter small permease n=2 Tax=Vibrio cincinnatiensis TaxID=675 RepID=UPI0012AC8A1F|nr:TRAP transporter small permease subunit [Vibrio cincinnatiensis]MCG3726157.1 TRAP transporter small permease [Vibrio cincinnatiensis]MCG3765088.1 TRAP transporter small permease [Vibrio cincinnatiensis]